MNPPESKSRLREAAGQRLKELTEHQRHDASKAICHRLQQLSREVGGCVLGFLPLPGEIDLEPYLRHRLGEGVAVPLVNWSTREMCPVLLKGLGTDDLEADRHGLRKPVDPTPVSLETIELVVVPGLAFNHECLRLGRGGGYYDRLLPGLSTGTRTIGICFDEQLVDDIPVEAWDQPVDEVLTPTQHFQSS